MVVWGSVFGGGVQSFCDCVVVVARFGLPPMVLVGVCVSFRPVSASSLSSCDGCRSGLLIPWSAGGLILLKR